MAPARRQQLDESILDPAAALFARYGFTQTSVQAVADAVGMSKAGLLHHFPSKEALRAAVVARSQALERHVFDQVRDIPPGPARDRIVLETLFDQALARPGLVALSLSFAAAMEADSMMVNREGANAMLLQAFGGDPDDERALRITGALAALSVLVLAAYQAGKGTTWRAHVIATSMGALGHPRTT